MENQHRLITGYRDLRRCELDLMNDIKRIGNDVLKPMYERIAQHIADETVEFGTPDAEHYRWLNIGRTHYQQALMAMTRAVAAPEFE